MIRPHRLLPLLLSVLLASGWAAEALAQAPDVSALLRAYPTALAGADGEFLIWRDGTRMELAAGDDGSPAAMLRDGSILDMLRQPYPHGPAAPEPGSDADPGRIRNRAFFDKMYGDCRRGEVAPHLVPVVWLPRHWGRTLRLTEINGVAAALEAVSAELDTQPDAVTAYLYPPGGGYNCRAVADAGQASMHGWGAAIDINVARSDYWHWRPQGRGGDAPPRPIPAVIVESFERHGFIWGGKWSHYDTMHFEYRPELLGLISQGP